MANEQTPDSAKDGAANEPLQDEISPEELAALGGQFAPAPPPAPGETLGDMISEDELAALSAQLSGGRPPPAAPKNPAPPPPPKPEPPKADAPKQAAPPAEPRLPELLNEEISGADNGLGLLMDVPLRVSIELGRVSMTLQQVLTLGRGSIVELDRLAGEPVDILVNDKPIGRGEVVVVDEYFGVKITELIDPKG